MKAFVLTIVAILLFITSATNIGLLLMLIEHLNREPVLWLLGIHIVTAAIGIVAILQWAVDPNTK